MIVTLRRCPWRRSISGNILNFAAFARLQKRVDQLTFGHEIAAR